MVYEPWHDKTNKMAVRPVKTQISLDIQPVWSESSLSAGRKLGSLAHSKDFDQTGRMADAQADLSLHWALTHFVGFVMSRLISGGAKGQHRRQFFQLTGPGDLYEFFQQLGDSI